MALNIKLIRESFEKAKPIATDIVNTFYTNLWSDYPVTRKVFEHVDMTIQKKTLLNSLVHIVDNLDRPELENYLTGMGKRHLKYGTKEEHYPMVKKSLLKTFSYYFEEDWTEELESE